MVRLKTPAAPGDPRPRERPAAAVPAAGERRVLEASARRAALKRELAPSARRPELLRVHAGVELGQLGEDRHGYLRRSIELVGRLLGPEVTRAISASGTWHVDCPRSWRTPSAMWVSPRR